jgi:hypothetical protein
MNMSKVVVNQKSLLCLLLMGAVSTHAYAAEPGTKSVTKKDAVQSGLSWSASVGLAYDSNIYRAPSAPYVDEAPSVPVAVTPDEQSGFYVPLGLKGVYRHLLNDSNALLTGYRFSGDLYIDSDFSNANNLSHKIRLGDEYTVKKNKAGSDTLYVGLLISSVKDQYVDRDSGLDQTTSAAVDVSDRYSYNATGIEAAYKSNTGKIKYALKFKLINRDYDDPVVISQYDNTYMSLGGDVKFRLSKPSKLKLAVRHYTYDYDERPSRNVQGRLFASNPTRNYTYNEFSIAYAHRINKHWRGYAEYVIKKRSDDSVGYHDYDADKIRLRIKYRHNKKLQMKLALTSWQRDYPNAFAFDRQSQGELDYDGVIVEFDSKYHIDKHRSFVAKFNWRDDNSTDLRYEYERSKVLLGMKWEY